MDSLEGKLNKDNTKIAWESDKTQECEFFEEKLVVSNGDVFYKKGSTKGNESEEEWKSRKILSDDELENDDDESNGFYDLEKMTGDNYMKLKTINIVSLFTLLLVGCTNNNKENTTTSTQPIDKKEKTSSSFTSQTTTSPTVEDTIDSTISEELTDIDEEKANEIAEIIVNDIKKQITATFEDKDDSSSWGSTISITFNEDGSLKMTESDNSFQKIDLTYEGTYSINNNAIASNILEHIRSRGIAEKEIKIKEALNISSYEDYVAFSNAKIPVDIDCTINGFMSKEIKDEEMKTQAEFEYRNLKLILSPRTYLFKKATQLSLTKI